MPGRDAILRGGTAALAAVALLAAGCGGGERQDADDEAGTYRVTLVEAEFPARQRLAEDAVMRIRVRNDTNRTIPNLAATIEAAGEGTQSASFGTLSQEKGLSSRSRPVWIVEEGPTSGDSAYANTWAVGPLAPDRTATLEWRAVPVVAGRYRLDYRLIGSLGGGARLQAQGGQPRGSFSVTVDDRPRRSRITDDGRVVRVGEDEGGREGTAGDDSSGGDASDADAGAQAEPRDG